MHEKLIIAAPRKVTYEKVELPPVGPTQIRVRALISAISHGTESVAYVGKSPFVDLKLAPERIFVPKQPGDEAFYPFRWAGYDLVGEVEEAGSQTKLFKVGDRVYAPVPHQSAYVFDENNPEILQLSPDTPPEDAIMIMLSTVALVGIHDAEVKLGDHVVVFGGGVVGQLALQMAFLSGAARVFLVEPAAERRRMAVATCPAEAIDPTVENPTVALRRMMDGKRPDVVLECSGNVQGLKAAVQAAGVAGTVVAVGFYAGSAAEFSFAEEFLHNRVTVKASMGVWDCPSRWPIHWNRRRELETARDLIAGQRLHFKEFAMLQVPFKEAQRAYETVLTTHRYMKTILTY